MAEVLTPPALYLPGVLRRAVWQEAQHAAPQECVGLLGGHKAITYWQAQQVYALSNVAPRPEAEYLADPRQTWKVLRQLRGAGQDLVGVYHSHPRGPAHYSPSDQAQAAYEVPHLIADLASGQLLAYWLPAGVSCPLLKDV